MEELENQKLWKRLNSFETRLIKGGAVLAARHYGRYKRSVQLELKLTLYYLSRPHRPVFADKVDEGEWHGEGAE